MRWLSQTVLQSSSLCQPSRQGHSVPGFSGLPPTLTSQAAVCSQVSLSFRDNSDIHSLLPFPVTVQGEDWAWGPLVDMSQF